MLICELFAKNEKHLAYLTKSSFHNCREAVKMTGNYEEVVKTARIAFDSGITRDIAFREKQLNGVLLFLTEHEDDILHALHKDLRKSKFEATLYELEDSIRDVRLALKRLRRYTADDHLPVNLIYASDYAYVHPEPYGVVLVLGAWNLPFGLIFKPLVGAIAGGNCAVIKPSEIATESANLISQWLPKYIHPECYSVVLTDGVGTKSLLKNKFDYIFFTGSCSTGSSVLQAAAPHLTPVALELGGKSPCYLDDTVNFKRAVRRILWGKIVNLGMACIAPDYLLCSRKCQDEFVKVAHQVLKEWYGPGKLQAHPDLPRLANKSHFQKVKRLLDATKGNIVFGGETDERDLWVEPTIVVDVFANDSLMEEEIFGPILPILNVNSPEEAIDFISSRPKPLALYIFSKEQAVYNKIIQCTSSGAVCVNDTILPYGWCDLPFGGVGNSGMGSYHDKHSFETFSHKRAVVVRGFGFLGELANIVRYPPYTQSKLNILRTALGNFEAFNLSFSPLVTHILAVLLGGLFAFLILN